MTELTTMVVIALRIVLGFLMQKTLEREGMLPERITKMKTRWSLTYDGISLLFLIGAMVVTVRGHPVDGGIFVIAAGVFRIINILESKQ